ncbi:MAG: NlpC/P60 family protein [Actinomycetota bacterium]|nr:NlpC/P60 family protein [Actinomycetota bacterium]
MAEELAQARLGADDVAGKVRSAEERMRDTDRRVGQARARLRGHAVASYVEGGELPAVQAMVGGSSDDLAVRSVYVKEAAGRQQAAEEAAGAQESTLRRVQGELGTLVAAETQRRAGEEASRAQAELAARQARAAAPVAASSTPGRAASRQPASRQPAPVLDLAPAPGARTNPPPAGAATAVAEARRQLGKPYRWGAAGPGSFDCSGLTLWAWRAGGRSLPHSSRAQFAATSRVPLSQIQPGDLVFYGSPIHHMGIYVGGGTMVEASQTGTPVRYASIYRRDMAGVGRVG